MKDFKSNFSSNLVKWVGIIFLIIIAYSFVDLANISNKKLIFSDFMEPVKLFWEKSTLLV